MICEIESVGLWHIEEGITSCHVLHRFHRLIMVDRVLNATLGGISQFLYVAYQCISPLDMLA